VASAYQGLYDELHDVPKGPAKMAVEGACWFDRHVEGLPPVSGDDQYIRFGEPGLHGFIRWVGELLSIKTPELRRQTIVAAMYATWIKNGREARKFWEEVARGGEELRRQCANHRPGFLAQGNGREAWQSRTETRESVSGLHLRVECFP
jgi:hypothetical protein